MIHLQSVGVSVNFAATYPPAPSLLPTLRAQLDEADAMACVAFANLKGVKLVEPQLKQLSGQSRMLVTTTFGSATQDALTCLADLGVDVRVQPHRRHLHGRLAAR
jgi:hypothetical protein